MFLEFQQVGCDELGLGDTWYLFYYHLVRGILNMNDLDKDFVFFAAERGWKHRMSFVSWHVPTVAIPNELAR